MAPTYCYECESDACQAQPFELQRTISARTNPAPCPVCGASTRRLMPLTAPVQPSKPIDVSNITGKRGQTAASAREADAIADKHNQIIIPKSEYKNTAGPMSKPTRKEEIKKELQEIDRSL